MEEKSDMAESIIKTFPILKDPVTGGYVSTCKIMFYTFFAFICMSGVKPTGVQS